MAKITTKALQLLLNPASEDLAPGAPLFGYGQKSLTGLLPICSRFLLELSFMVEDVYDCFPVARAKGDSFGFPSPVRSAGPIRFRISTNRVGENGTSF